MEPVRKRLVLWGLLAVAAIAACVLLLREPRGAPYAFIEGAQLVQVIDGSGSLVQIYLVNAEFDDFCQVVDKELAGKGRFFRTYFRPDVGVFWNAPGITVFVDKGKLTRNDILNEPRVVTVEIVQLDDSLWTKLRRLLHLE